jgi:hypothetical protein
MNWQRASADPGTSPLSSPAAECVGQNRPTTPSAAQAAVDQVVGAEVAGKPLPARSDPITTTTSFPVGFATGTAALND